jgi:hypothetical protein
MFGGLTIDEDTTKNGTVNIPKMLYFGKKMKVQCSTRPTKIPAHYLTWQVTSFLSLELYQAGVNFLKNTLVRDE